MMSNRNSRLLVGLLVFLIGTSNVLAVASNTTNNEPQSPQSNVTTRETARVRIPPVQIEQYKLSNGLRVVLSQDRSRPVIAVAVYYDVGSRNEKVGRTGFAHLFEHMMFQGSENVGKAEHFQYIYNAGGTMNGSTSSERTNYFEALPSYQLPLALWLESDRMRSLKVTQENLDNQRSAVKDEKRLNYDNRPYANAFIRANEMVFKNFANAHSTIGSMDDLNAATVEDVRDFFRIYYAPNNAVLVICGDFDPKTARELVDKYFATIPGQPKPPVVDVSEPPPVAVRHEIYNDKFAPLPGFALGWKAPPRSTSDYYALSLANNLLSDGESSRLYQRLVKGDESVAQINSGLDGRRGPSRVQLFALPKPGKDPAQIRSVIFAEIKRLATEGPTAEEMNKLHNNLINDGVRGRQSALFRAQRIAEFALYDGDPNLFNTNLENFLKVTPEQIKQATARYLDTENHTLIEIVPARGSNSAAAKPTEKSEKD